MGATRCGMTRRWAGAPALLAVLAMTAMTATAQTAVKLPKNKYTPQQDVELGREAAAEVRQRAHGDPDAFSFDDFHVARNVSYALTGTVMDDDGCAEVIACYAGHRYRVQRLLELARVVRPRRGPRMTLPTHTPSATAGNS